MLAGDVQPRHVLGRAVEPGDRRPAEPGAEPIERGDDRIAGRQAGELRAAIRAAARAHDQRAQPDHRTPLDGVDTAEPAALAAAPGVGTATLAAIPVRRPTSAIAARSISASDTST